MLLATFSVVSWSSMSSSLATSDAESISSSVFFRIMDNWGVSLTLGMSKPKL